MSSFPVNSSVRLVSADNAAARTLEPDVCGVAGVVVEHVLSPSGSVNFELGWRMVRLVEGERAGQEFLFLVSQLEGRA